MSKEIEISKRYAQAIFDVSKEANKQDQFLDELRKLRTAFEKTDGLTSLLQSPMVHIDDKKKLVLGAVGNIGLSPEIIQLIEIMGNNNRLSYFESVVDTFESVSDSFHGVAKGNVLSSNPLDSKSREELINTIGQFLNKQVILEFKEDPNLVGGIRATVGSYTFDGSMTTQLKNMNEELKRSAH